jgi:hypothetical protein
MFFVSPVSFSIHLLRGVPFVCRRVPGKHPFSLFWKTTVIIMFKYLFTLALLVIHHAVAFTVVVAPAARAASSRLFAEAYKKMDDESKINLKV